MKHIRAQRTQLGSPLGPIPSNLIPSAQNLAPNLHYKMIKPQLFKVKYGTYNSVYILSSDIEQALSFQFGHIPFRWVEATLTSDHVLYSPENQMIQELDKDKNLNIQGTEYLWIKYPHLFLSNSSPLMFLTTNPQCVDKYLLDLDKLNFINHI